MNLPELIDKLHSDASCRKHLERIRWPRRVTCPACGGKSISRIVKRAVFECNKCRRQFSVTSGTIFHDSHLSLRTWFLAIHRITESNKGVSASQLTRELGITYKTAWYLCHRIRAAIKQPTGPGLRGIIEVDETYVRGKGVPRGEKLKRGPASQRTTPVIGARDRNKRVRAKVLKAVSKETTWPSILSQFNRQEVSAVYTDEHGAYRGLNAYVPHGTICHALFYSIGDLHTNGIESFWSLLKRGIVGSYHHVSPKHLQRYVDEYCWRNNTEGTDLFTALLSAQALTEPLQYRRLLSGASPQSSRSLV